VRPANNWMQLTARVVGGAGWTGGRHLDRALQLIRSFAGPWTLTMTSTEILRWRREWSAATETLWADLCAARTPTVARQEALQLLAAAAAYHVNGVRALADAAIHCPAVSADSTVPWDAKRYCALFDAYSGPS
jgi:hypothetical protein